MMCHLDSVCFLLVNHKTGRRNESHRCGPPKEVCPNKMIMFDYLVQRTIIVRDENSRSSMIVVCQSNKKVV